ncbi:glycosyltransferase [Kordiimonas marina]|uniref:glycosyltransferase n=1 Tax=Kordiimonas marina TaxID=2872312 RepID=UPI001FF58ED8|nr:glycosyltransferase [Kordiimonas marina]MCJ9430764.1 hypothetical protein [Kordiimonas marina]
MTTEGHDKTATCSGASMSLNPVAYRGYARPSAGGLSDVLHVCRADWHGILSATMALPGHKLLLAPEGAEPAVQDEAAPDALCQDLEDLGIRAVCFQGFSQQADSLARALRRQFGASLPMAAVSHVTTTQFQAPFEIRMQAALRKAQADGVLTRLGSVKPGFSMVMPEVWHETLINFCPVMPMPAPPPSTTGDVLVPVENHWRKGLYTNLIAALRTPEVQRIHSINTPTHLDLLGDLGRVHVTGFLDRPALYALMARVDMVMNVSLAECQPMTQLEAFALGRPCLTGPLGLSEFADDEIIERCTVSLVDTPTEAGQKLSELMSLWARDGAYVQALISDHMTRRHALAEQRYMEFLEL